MSTCVICQEVEAEPGSLACPRDAGRLAGALRQIPGLVDELHGLGYVERDTRPGTRAVREGNEIVRVPAMADPVANLFAAGPTKSTWSESRVRSTRPERLPIAIDPTDLLMPARAGSLRPHSGPYAADQDGHLSVATVLDFWVRDWADLRGEGLPPVRTRERSPVAQLAGWLAVRLDWALREHPALDEFARDTSDLFGALFGLARGGRARPKPMEADCPRCGLATLVQATPEDSIECVAEDCRRVLTPAEYAEHVRDLIEEAS